MGPLPNSQQLLGIPGVLQGSLCLHRIQHSVVRAAALPAGNAVGTHPSLPQALQGSHRRKSCNSPFCSAIIQLHQRKDPLSAMSSVANHVYIYIYGIIQPHQATSWISSLVGCRPRSQTAGPVLLAISCLSSCIGIDSQTAISLSSCNKSCRSKPASTSETD